MKRFLASKEKRSHYFKHSFKSDIIAALTVSMIAVPQAMAYAVVAGVNPVYGLYAAILPAIIGSVFGSSNHVVTGPTNTVALATSGVLVLVMGRMDYPEFVFALAILSGVIRLLLGLLRLGFIIRYVSNSVLTGFLTGAAVLIMLNQLPQVLGLPSAASHNLFGVLSHIVAQIQDVNFLVLGVGFSCIVLLLGIRRFLPRFPSALAVILLTGALVYHFNWQAEGIRLVGDMGDVRLSEMSLHFPGGVWEGEHLVMLLTGAGAIALLSLLEAVSVAKSIALQTGQRVDANQEFVGQGLASITSGLFHGVPTSGSLTRSAVNYGGGAVTRAASGFSGLQVLLVLLIFKDWIQYIPMVSLGSIVIVSAFSMINFHHIALTWHGRAISKIVIGVTFLAVLLLPLQVSIYLGVILSMIFYLIESSHLKLTYLVLNGNDKFVEHEIEEVYKTKPEIAVINVEGPLYFAAVQDLEDQIIRLIDVGVKVIVLRLRRMHLMASSGVSTLEFLVRRAREKGGSILLTGVGKDEIMVLKDCGLEDDFQTENIYLATEIPYESTRQAIAQYRTRK